MTQPSANLEFSRNLINSVFDMFVTPELTRRGMSLGRDEILQVVVEIDPDSELKYPRVWLNEEAQIVAQARVAREVEDGEPLTEADVDVLESVKPAALGSNSGFMCFVRFKGQEYVNFDFRYNKERAAALLGRAREFLAVARGCAGTAPAVACDNAFSAAELSIQAQMITMQQITKNHWVRQEWLNDWVSHQNAPGNHASVLRELHEHRAAGRYADRPFGLAEGRLGDLLDTTQEMIDLASNRLT